MQKIKVSAAKTNKFYVWAWSDHVTASLYMKASNAIVLWKGKGTHRTATARSACLPVILEESWAGRSAWEESRRADHSMPGIRTARPTRTSLRNRRCCLSRVSFKRRRKTRTFPPTVRAKRKIRHRDFRRHVGNPRSSYRNLAARIPREILKLQNLISSPD